MYSHFISSLLQTAPQTSLFLTCLPGELIKLINTEKLVASYHFPLKEKKYSVEKQPILRLK